MPGKHKRMKFTGMQALDSPNVITGSTLESGIRRETFLLVEPGSWDLNRNTAQGIRTPTNNWNPESKFP